VISKGQRKDRKGNSLPSCAFQFPRRCWECGLRPMHEGQSSQGRTVKIHPQERLLQEARAFQKARLRTVPEVASGSRASSGSLMQLGCDSALRWKNKTLFQLLMRPRGELTLVRAKWADAEPKPPKAHLFVLLLARSFAQWVASIVKLHLAADQLSWPALEG